MEENQKKQSTEVAEVSVALPTPVEHRPSASRNACLQPKNLSEVFELGNVLAAAGQYDLRPNDGPKASIRILMGMELGYTALQSMRLVYEVNGKPAISTDMLVGLVKTSPVCNYFRVVNNTAKSCVVETLRVGSVDPATYEFTIEDAKLAGLLNKDPWKKYPKVMLYKRAAAFLCRQVYPAVCGGLHTREEMESIATSDADREADRLNELRKRRVEAMGLIEKAIEDAAANPITQNFAGHMLDAFCCVKSVDYISDAQDDVVVRFADYLAGIEPVAFIGFVVKHSASFQASTEKKANPAPEQEEPEGADDRDGWKEQNRHLRAILAGSGIEKPNDVVRAFKVAKKKKSLTEIPAEQIKNFIDDLQSDGGDRMQGRRVPEAMLESAVHINAEAFRKLVLNPDNKGILNELYSEVFSGLTAETGAKIEARFLIGHADRTSLEECPADDLSELLSMLVGASDDEIESYILSESK